ncbi:phytanoyl-CoA dioxygenase family protein [Foetidibacter luteolus]|uniref:phytanoyl-CoA dioxygenase family protein n=1 Tax=Foetidibacter luteolus TaxID=2608880 RepID=UPI00129AA2F6|nr:phytanoyl-CoA dioxygenase family protein [Foetidibacter luteolus]
MKTHAELLPVINQLKEQFERNGFAIAEGIYSTEEIDAILYKISAADNSGQAFRKTADLFAIRRFLHEVPAVKELVFNKPLESLIHDLFGHDYFVVKSIYFDKPALSNWFVSYHQDLTIALRRKKETPGFINWTVKQDAVAVQPPLEILENNFTLRIHLDDTDEDNGALKVIPGSHVKGIYRPENIDWAAEQEITCVVPKGGVMIMKPLLLHASGKTTGNRKRRVIHIEFTNTMLPPGLEWAEIL